MALGLTGRACLSQIEELWYGVNGTIEQVSKTLYEKGPWATNVTAAVLEEVKSTQIGEAIST